jgi:hypothetical protein
VGYALNETGEAYRVWEFMVIDASRLPCIVLPLRCRHPTSWVVFDDRVYSVTSNEKL